MAKVLSALETLFECSSPNGPSNRFTLDYFDQSSFTKNLRCISDLECLVRLGAAPIKIRHRKYRGLNHFEPDSSNLFCPVHNHTHIEIIIINFHGFPYKTFQFSSLRAVFCHFCVLGVSCSANIKYMPCLFI